MRRSATSRRITPLHLIAVLLIVAGLAVSAPPACWCAPDDHFGLLLHPMFPHGHGDAHAAWLDVAATSTDGASSTAVDQAPGISAQASENGAREMISGMLLPLSLAAVSIEMSRRRPLTEPRPDERALSPPTPPPRLVPAVV